MLRIRVGVERQDGILFMSSWSGWEIIGIINTRIINIGIVSSQKWVVNGFYYYLMRRINPQLRIMRSSTGWRIGRNLYVLRSVFINRNKILLRMIVRSIVWKIICIIKRWLDGVARWPVDLTWGSFSSLTLCRFIPRGIIVRSWRLLVGLLFVGCISCTGVFRTKFAVLLCMTLFGTRRTIP